MIAIKSTDGEILKSIPFKPGKTLGYHHLFGFVSEEVFLERRQNRIRHGFKNEISELEFSCEISGTSEKDFTLAGFKNCSAARSSQDQWSLKFENSVFTLSPMEEIKKLPISAGLNARDTLPLITTLSVALLVAIGFALFPKSRIGDDVPVIVEQMIVKIQQEKQKPVDMTSVLDKIPEIKKQADVTKRAINQKLGFLGLLGRKDLKLAVGGAPTRLKDASPGAGAGGNAGSGGELLVGLGQGLKRTTVGNSGVSGLGGVGTKGAGGGAGGYGTSSIGSGEGRTLSSVAQSQDLILEGGLDRSVVQATIAKYLSQVRACYETGLKKNPGLGGQVTMAFEIGGDGDLDFARVQRSSLDDREVEGCISQKMLSWKFPKPRGGVKVKVSYPFVLRATQT